MASVALTTPQRLALLEYAEKHGATSAAALYGVSRQFVYRMRWRYNGTAQSLEPRSRRPHHHPCEHTEAEDALIRKVRQEFPHGGLCYLWGKLRQRGYQRTHGGLYHRMIRLGLRRDPAANPKYVPKPYQPALFPGEKVQIDVKVVPRACLVGEARELGLKMYQYTAIDECTRLRYLGAFSEQSSYSSALFLEQLVAVFPFRICKVQTDNGFEFTNRYGKSRGARLTLFERKLADFDIEHQKIKPHTPRHNGKVERSHRKDNEQFYAVNTFATLEEFAEKLACRNDEYNDLPMRALGWHSPNELLLSFTKNCNR